MFAKKLLKGKCCATITKIMKSLKSNLIVTLYSKRTLICFKQLKSQQLVTSENIPASVFYTHIHFIRYISTLFQLSQAYLILEIDYITLLKQFEIIDFSVFYFVEGDQSLTFAVDAKLLLIQFSSCTTLTANRLFRKSSFCPNIFAYTHIQLLKLIGHCNFLVCLSKIIIREKSVRRCRKCMPQNGGTIYDGQQLFSTHNRLQTNFMKIKQLVLYCAI